VRARGEDPEDGEHGNQEDGDDDHRDVEHWATAQVENVVHLCEKRQFYLCTYICIPGY
jgi:hypothetical protein